MVRLNPLTVIGTDLSAGCVRIMLQTEKDLLAMTAAA